MNCDFSEFNSLDEKKLRTKVVFLRIHYTCVNRPHRVFTLVRRWNASERENRDRERPLHRREWKSARARRPYAVAGVRERGARSAAFTRSHLSHAHFTACSHSSNESEFGVSGWKNFRRSHNKYVRMLSKEFRQTERNRLYDFRVKIESLPVKNGWK